MPDEKPIALHGPDPDDGDELRAVLRREADRIAPTDRMDRIIALTQRRAHPRRLWPVLAAAAAVLLLGAVVVPALSDRPSFTVGEPAGDHGQAPASQQAASQPTRTDPSEAASSTVSPSSAVQRRPRALGIYYLGAWTRRSVSPDLQFRLFREFRSLSVNPQDLGDPVVVAVQSMLTGPTDSDYLTAWAGVTVRRASVANDVITVRLAGTPKALPTSVSGRAAVQQLVWTATAGYGKSVGVKIIFDSGRTNVFGVDLTHPIRRQPDLQAPVWITDPVTGQRDKAGKVTVTGVSTSYESVLSWTIINAETGAVVAHGTAKGGSNGTYAPFVFSTTLKAGRYTVAVRASDGSGQDRSIPDTKTWTVT